ncbi:MAG TPA: PRC-barrel domain-containing protein [Verrucomicrobiae bacterium]|nr:PRC-barrel domain-containing protein [Verrucomicrobiae bacterium]
MKSKLYQAAWLTIALGSVCLMTAYGQSTGPTSATPGAPLASAERAANLYGRQLIGSDNQPIGKIDNVVVDLESEHILYVVVGTSKGKVAVPPQVIGQTTGNTIRANVTAQKVAGAPQFTSDLDKPDQLGQASFVYRVAQYFGATPWWQGSGPANQGSFHNVHKLNQLIGMSVEDVNNQTIGKISNVIVDLPKGRILYVVFEPASSLNLGNNLYAMPSDGFTLGSDQKHLVTGIDRQKLAAAPHFDKNNWPNVTDPSFASQVYQYYGKQAYFNAGGGNYQPTGR